jgi:hypothetical protein
MTETITKRETKPLYTVLDDGRWCFYIDYSTIKDFSLCEQYFNYRHVQLIKPRGLGSMSMNVGSWWSLALEKIYTEIQQTEFISQSKCQLLSADAWNELGMSQFEQVEPKAYKDFGGHNGAIVMIDEYFESHIKDDMKRFKIVSAESGFGLKGEILVGENSRVVVYWIGKPDLTVLDGRRLSPLDHKSVSRIDGDVHGKYKPHPQIAGYCFAINCLAKQTGLDVSVDRAIINVCARKSPPENPRDGKKRPRFVRVLVTYSPDELEEWRLGVMNKVSRIREAVESGAFLWNENVCSNMYFKPCPYRGIDSNPPASRLVIIQSNYDKAERWVPYKTDSEEE